MTLITILSIMYGLKYSTEVVALVLQKQAFITETQKKKIK